jgi:peptidyl-prolyl cis-trans isomerase SurA
MNSYRIISSILLLCFTITPALAQDDKTLLTIGDAKISLADYERIYKKNNNNLLNETDIKTPEEYLDLYINFKLKVEEAKSLKMDTAASFIDELKGYRDELAAPYLTDVRFQEGMVKELYERMKKEVNASHILFLLDKNAPESKVQEVLSKITRLRDEIVAGKDFNEAAREFSEDPSAQMNGGNLSYFNAFQMVAPFEDAAFSTPKGQVSMPVRSSFGYHLIKINDIRENRGEIRVAHIMKTFPQGMNPDYKIKLKSEMDSIYQALKNGADFAEMAKKYSDDKRSAVQGGEMPWFSAGRMIPEFSEPAFSIQNINEFTTPVESPYGFHIIKKLETRTIAPFEQLKNEIETRIKKDPERSETNKKAFIDKLKEEYLFSKNTENFEKIQELPIGQSTEKLEDMKLFTIDGIQFTLKSFNEYLEKKNLTNGTYASHQEDWIDDEITALEDSKLESKYPEFRDLMQEYHDGILLFNISEEKIWNFAATDTAGLEKFFQKNKGKYMWEERFKGCVVTCDSEETREEADQYFAAGMNNDEILSLINRDEPKIEITEGAWEKGSHPVVDYFAWNGPEPHGFGETITFVRGDKVPPAPKNLDEARGLYISDYQNHIEEMWIKELRRKYKIKVNKNLLKTIPGV